MKMLFADSRPFWDARDVDSYGICTYEYASPNIQGFFVSFSAVYLYMQHRKIYSNMNSKWLNGFLIFLIVFLLNENIIGGAWNGITYMY
jgi:hypothetical protein